MAEQVKDLSIEYDAIPFALSEYASMKELFRSAFHIKLRYQEFMVRFDTSLLGNEVIGFIAKHRKSNKPAAYYGVFPINISIDNKVVLAAQSGDTMTHQDHRKKGLFVWLAKMTFEKCEKRGIALIFGQPNNKSSQGLINRLNFLPIDYINSYDLKLKLKTIPLAKSCINIGLFKTYLKIAKRILSKVTIDTVHEFHNTHLNHYGSVLRDSNYLEYKKSENKVFLKINEATLWIKLSDVLWIGDFDNYALVDEKTIKKLKKIAAFLGYNTIRFNFNASLHQPAFLKWFKKESEEASCFFYIDKAFEASNLVITAADFDTW